MNLRKLSTATVLICLVSASCQSTTTISKIPDAPKAAPDPLPEWTNAQGGTAEGKGRFVKVQMKIIEVTYDAGESNVPEKPYRQRMDDRETKALLARLNQRKGADILTAPAVVTEEGQCAKIEIGQELIVPKDVGENPEFTTEMIGVSNYIRARPSADGRTIRLDVLTQIREQDGFKEVKPGLRHPVILARRAGSGVEIANGGTILFGGVVDEREETVEDITLGIFRKRSVTKFSRELLVLATATVVDEAGRVVAVR